MDGLRRRIDSGKPVLNGWLHIPNSWTAELMALSGWDTVTIDFQHGFHDIPAALSMLQAIAAGGSIPMVRVPWNEPTSIMRLLDAGAPGLICPMIETRAQCEDFISWCRYPPDGRRSLGPTRAKTIYGPSYAADANRWIVAFAMIETVEGYRNAQDICGVPGLDGVFIGTGDLRLSLAIEGRESELEDTIQAIRRTCEAHGLVPGLFTPDVDEGLRRIDEGFRFITVKTDATLLKEHATEVVTRLRTSQADSSVHGG